MTKDVLLAMKGMQFEVNNENGRGENVEIITAAQYFDKGDHSYLLYDEIMEGTETPVSNIVRFDDNSIEVTKKGMINVHMIFEEGKQNLTNYQTPYGTLVVGINTKKIDVTREEELIHISAEYGLDINYEFLADCKLCMDITPKEMLRLS